MSWINDLKKWFWGELKPELQEPQFEKPKPIVPETTGKVLKEENEIHKTVEKKETVKKKKPRKTRKPRKTKKKETGE